MGSANRDKTTSTFDSTSKTQRIGNWLAKMNKQQIEYLLTKPTTREIRRKAQRVLRGMK